MAGARQERSRASIRYATDATREEFVGRLTRDGLAAPFCYYCALVEGVYYEQEKKLPAERYKVTTPYLFISGMLDIICLPQAIEKAKEMGLTPNLTVKEVDAGYRCLLAKPKEVGEIFVKWLGDNFSASRLDPLVLGRVVDLLQRKHPDKGFLSQVQSF